MTPTFVGQGDKDRSVLLLLWEGKAEQGFTMAVGGDGPEEAQ